VPGMIRQGAPRAGIGRPDGAWARLRSSVLILLLAAAPAGGCGSGATGADAGWVVAPPPPRSLERRQAGWTGGFELLRGLGVTGEQTRTEQEQALAASLALWPGISRARVHLHCPRPGWGSGWEGGSTSHAACRAAVVLQPGTGAAPAELPAEEEVRRLVSSASAIADPRSVEVVWVAAASAASPAPSAAPSPSPLEQVGPFRVAAGSGGWLRLVLLLLCATVAGLAAIVLLERRHRRAPPGVGSPRSG